MMEDEDNVDSTLDEPHLPTTPLYEDFGQYGVPVPDEDAVEYHDSREQTWFGPRCEDWMQDTPTYE